VTERYRQVVTAAAECPEEWTLVRHLRCLDDNAVMNREQAELYSVVGMIILQGILIT
jgi:hypothetical protein